MTSLPRVEPRPAQGSVGLHFNTPRSPPPLSPTRSRRQVKRVRARPLLRAGRWSIMTKVNGPARFCSPWFPLRIPRRLVRLAAETFRSDIPNTLNLASLSNCQTINCKGTSKDRFDSLTQARHCHAHKFLNVRLLEHSRSPLPEVPTKPPPFPNPPRASDVPRRELGMAALPV